MGPSPPSPTRTPTCSPRVSAISPITLLTNGARTDSCAAAVSAESHASSSSGGGAIITCQTTSTTCQHGTASLGITAASIPVVTIVQILSAGLAKRLQTPLPHVTCSRGGGLVATHRRCHRSHGRVLGPTSCLPAYAHPTSCCRRRCSFCARTQTRRCECEWECGRGRGCCHGHFNSITAGPATASKANRAPTHGRIGVAVFRSNGPRFVCDHDPPGRGGW